MIDIIKSIVNRISVYGLINHLIPGAIYVVLVNSFTTFTIPLNNDFEMIIICYFIGVTISRIGTWADECIFHKKRKKGDSFVPYRPYTEFCSAEKKDKEMRLRFLSDVNDMYRTFFALSLALTVTAIADILWDYIESRVWIEKIAAIAAAVVMMFLYVFSYSKQSKYVVDRIEFLNKEHEGK